MITVKAIDDKQEWQELLAKFDQANFLQSWQWGQAHQTLGQTVYRLAFMADNKCLGLMQAIVEPAKRGRYLAVAAGPLIDWSDDDLVKTAVNKIREIAKQEKCVFARVRPQLADSPKAQTNFKELGFKPAPMHLYAENTSILDLTNSLDGILQAMRKQTRYEVRRSEKLGIEVSVENDSQSLKNFYQLQAETARRQGFVMFSYQNLEAEFFAMAVDGLAKLYRARLKDQILAEAIIFYANQEAAYYQGASTVHGRKLPGAYAIQWQAIKDAKEAGLKRYNFWGTAPEGQMKHRFAGVTTFKRGFGGQDVAYLHAHDLVINKSAYLKTLTIEKIRKKRRGL